MRKLRCYSYKNHATWRRTFGSCNLCGRTASSTTTCDHLYKFVQHLQRAHGQIPSRIIIDRVPAKQAISKTYEAAIESAYTRR